MGKNTKLVHFQIIGGNESDIKKLTIALNKLKTEMDMDIQFLVTNDRIELYSVKYLIEELIKIYKLQEKLVEKKKQIGVKK